MDATIGNHFEKHEEMDKTLICEVIRQSLAQADSAQLLRNRLYLSLRQAILDHRLEGGTLLPSSRQLCQELAIGRKTVVHAYEQLLMEGYLESRAGSGTYVSEALSGRSAFITPRRLIGTRREGLSRRGNQIASQGASSTIQRGAFIPGVPDTDLFPFAVWRRLMGKYTNKNMARFLDYASSGYGPLKTVIAEYLSVTRLMKCQARQIVLLNGTHQALDLCARMLCDVGDRVWIEEPGYWGARNVMTAAGLTPVPIPLDERGIAPRPQDWKNSPRLIYVSPSSQYPTGTVLALDRRLELLEGADSHGAWIIEDDYDNEQHYDKSTVASLFGLSQKQRVIYLGTFSKVMFPGLRLAYMVLPEDLVEAFQVGNSELYRGGRLIEQAALAEFIADGHFTAHIKRMRSVYKERRDCLCEALDKRLAGAIELSGGHAGLQLLYYFTEPIDDAMVASDAMSKGLIVRPLSMYYQDQGQVRSGMNLGYGGVSVERIRTAAPMLADVIEARLLRRERLRRT
ncbi:MAG: GntR family transcriptional regulator [Proteobacteria bacterium]|nr:GntR family transcriptional regulator [Pseudomonadota bacterium]